MIKLEKATSERSCSVQAIVFTEYKTWIYYIEACINKRNGWVGSLCYPRRGRSRVRFLPPPQHFCNLAGNRLCARASPSLVGPHLHHGPMSGMRWAGWGALRRMSKLWGAHLQCRGPEGTHRRGPKPEGSARGGVAAAGRRASCRGPPL